MKQFLTLTTLASTRQMTSLPANRSGRRTNDAITCLEPTHVKSQIPVTPSVRVGLLSPFHAGITRSRAPYRTSHQASGGYGQSSPLKGLVSSRRGRIVFIATICAPAPRVSLAHVNSHVSNSNSISHAARLALVRVPLSGTRPPTVASPPRSCLRGGFICFSDLQARPTVMSNYHFSAHSIPRSHPSADSSLAPHLTTGTRTPNCRSVPGENAKARRGGRLEPISSAHGRSFRRNRSFAHFTPSQSNQLPSPCSLPDESDGSLSEQTAQGAFTGPRGVHAQDKKFTAWTDYQLPRATGSVESVDQAVSRQRSLSSDHTVPCARTPTHPLRRTMRRMMPTFFG
ncbi:unnamed protein product [Protopolystoma xenopodis]|uniref:Uncharacterized protein n=1 Tax=Protopolystoma xenopodis TaxID=117903 RepID=A0A448WY11_9PLAT|nr:unnamed protein product [Protopolystoma xenopodis]